MRFDTYSLVLIAECLIIFIDCLIIFVKCALLSAELRKYRERLQNQPQVVQIVYYVTIYETKAPKEP
jgi:hypothetical protein